MRVTHPIMLVYGWVGMADRCGRTSQHLHCLLREVATTPGIKDERSLYNTECLMN